MTTISFEVFGVPAPQGSHSAVMAGGRPHLIVGSSKVGRAKHRNWRSAVAEAAKDVLGRCEQFDGPIQVDIVYRFAMPKSRPAAIRRHGEGWKTTAPDKDKLDRATYDGLTAGGLIGDDKLICAGGSMKLEVSGWTGALVTIKGLPMATPSGPS